MQIKTIKVSLAMKAMKIYVRGTVQGVGFRPFVYRIAVEEGISGFVRNTPGGVEIHVEGENGFSGFLEKLKSRHPPSARIDHVRVEEALPLNLSGFRIDMTTAGEAVVFAPPDLSMCEACGRELLDPSDRRYHYPFINCTACGPRYTIIGGLPYDRGKTSMSTFGMCGECESEYLSPLDRRFHAEPNACPRCGPAMAFVEKGRREEGGIEKAVAKIREGKVVAVKGLGGFHLVCDPFNRDAVERLRRAKARERKPFALMARDAAAAREVASFGGEELAVLSSPERPIVLLAKKREIEGISPGIDTYGIMLPYTPLHHLLMLHLPLIVATSANFRESPIIKDEEEGLEDLADCVLTHNRKIVARCDDSVVKVFKGKPLFIRRARGYVPDPIAVSSCGEGEGIMALGGELKNTVSILKDGYVITSQFLGDMKDYRNLRYMDEIIEHFSCLYSFRSRLFACDLHPDFTTTRLAERSGRPAVRVQHHVAHIFAVAGEHGLDPRSDFLGVAFDGMGYGEDGKVWGGEIFAFGGGGVRRRWHLRFVPQQGGDLAVREPWRMALSYLLDAGCVESLPGILQSVDEKRLAAVRRGISMGVNSPLTSSAGRLFDAVSSIAGISPLEIDYEAEAAMRIEAAAHGDEKRPYKFAVREEEIDFREMIREIAGGEEREDVVSARFHRTLASAVSAVAAICRERYGIRNVILGGGVFMNVVLLEMTVSALARGGFSVYYPKRFSPGDESISVGQIFYCLAKGA